MQETLNQMNMTLGQILTLLIELKIIQLNKLEQELDEKEFDKLIEKLQQIPSVIGR